jgi:hypothetical protein
VLDAGSGRYETWIASITDGTTRKVADASATLSKTLPIDFSLDGALLATLEGAQALKVVDVATGGAVTWAPELESASVTHLAFADDRVLVVEATVPGSTAGSRLFRATAASATLLGPGGVDNLRVLARPPGAGRYLFTERGDAFQSKTIELFDLAAPSPTGVVLSTQADGVEAISDDLSAVLFVDRLAGSGLAALPSGRVTPLPWGARFIPGGSEVLYLDRSNQGTDGEALASPLMQWDAGATQVVVPSFVWSFLVRGQHLYYAKRDDYHCCGDWNTSVWRMPLP